MFRAQKEFISVVSGELEPACLLCQVPGKGDTAVKGNTFHRCCSS